MPTSRAGETVAALARAVLSLQPLVDVLEEPPRLPLFGDDAGGMAVPEVVERILHRLGAPRWRRTDPTTAPTASPPGVFDRVVAERLEAALPGGGPAPLPAVSPAEVDATVDRVLASSFERRYPRVELASFDGAPLGAYAAGHPAGEPVVLVSACGMPAKLCRRWMELLSAEHRVVTWESRGLFLGDPDFDRRRHDVAAQAGDLFAVLDHLGVDAAHLMGLCGGAVVALRAAAERPARVRSLSLWHGDYDLGPEGPKTDHQRNLQALMEMAAESRPSAASVRTAIFNSMRGKPLPELAHLVLYPYANPELMYRYGKLNGSIMHTAVEPLLAEVRRPALVVTSEDDHTAHPEGSRRVAEALPGATLRVEPHGDHISLFRARGATPHLARTFLAGTGNPP